MIVNTRAIFAGLGVLALSFPASAQLSSQGGPIRLKADSSEVRDAERKVILVDNVDITQGDARLRANIVTVAYAGNGNEDAGGLSSSFGDIKSMTAQGDVFYVTPELKANGSLGVYEAATDVITLTGDVILVRGDDVAKGKTLTMDLANGVTKLDGAVNMVIVPGEGTNE